MACRLDRLEPERVAQHWNECEPYARSAAERSFGRYTEAHIRHFAITGAWQLWRAMDDGVLVALCGTEMIRYPTGAQSIAIRFGAGRHRETWQHLMEQILSEAKQQGCSFAEGGFRIGWRRVLPGWRHTHDVLERSL